MDTLTPLVMIPMVVLYLIALGGLIIELISVLPGREMAFGRGWRFVEGCILIVLGIAIFLDIGSVNDCCNGTAFLSPSHRLSILVLVILSLAAYFYSARRKNMAPPALEVLVNCILLIGVVLCIMIGLQEEEWWAWVITCLPAGALFVIALIRNHALALATLRAQADEGPRLVRWCRKILLMPVFAKIPLLLLLCLPVLLVLISILLLFGQQPDSMIRAFTDTYKQGLSQLDSQCIGVPCPEGHFLCSVAAGGHPGFVRPIRAGVRHGQRILCNRQLLVANAFEELLQQRLPGLHRPIRRYYNRIGRLVHRYYGVFNHKWVADTVYLLMKPLEWIFLITLYLADRRPEDRIAKQYTYDGR
jgi:hypothetical protein